jgi:osmotically-inducible protein OsmY
MMKMTRLRGLQVSGLAMICTLLFACVPQNQDKNVSEYLDSVTVTKHIQTKLIDKLGAAGFGIKVRAYRNEVLLSGVVTSQAIREQAGQIAASEENIKRVRNDLVIK